jgi:hypothetical protein
LLAWASLSSAQEDEPQPDFRRLLEGVLDMRLTKSSHDEDCAMPELVGAD